VRNVKQVPGSEVYAAALALHQIFTGSMGWTLERIDLRNQKGYEWYQCDFPPETLSRVVVHGGHHHGSPSSQWLMQDHDTIGKAVITLTLAKNYEIDNPECFATISAIRSTVRAGGSVGPVFLSLEPDGSILHIDGLHRALVWLLEGRSEDVPGYLCRSFPKSQERA